MNSSVWNSFLMEKMYRNKKKTSQHVSQDEDDDDEIASGSTGNVCNALI